MCKPQLNFPAPYAPLDTILDSGRVLRRPLGEWAHQLVTILRSCMDATPEMDRMYEASATLNNAALVFVHAGLPQIAEEICQSQLAWISGFRGLLPEAELAVLAMQPWVNLGRLCRRAGEHERALHYFSELSNCRVNAVVKFGDWNAPVCRTLYEAAEPIYVYESMRTYLQAGEQDRAIAFAQALDEPLLRSTLMLKTELLIHISLQQCKPEKVLSLTKAMPWPEDHYGTLARYFYVAIALESIGQRQASANALERVKPQLFTYVQRQDMDSRNIRFVLEACRLAAHLGLRELFINMLSVCCSLVLRAADVPFASGVLRLAAQQGCSTEMEDLARLEEFASLSGYPVTTCSSSSSIAGELAELQSAVSQFLCIPLHACCA